MAPSNDEGAISALTLRLKWQTDGIPCVRFGFLFETFDNRSAMFCQLVNLPFCSSVMTFDNGQTMFLQNIMSQ